MPDLSITQLAHLTGKARETIIKALDGVSFIEGVRTAKLFPSKAALEKIYNAASVNGKPYVSNTEAQRLYTIARKDQVNLEMEVTRKQRIPLADLEEVNNKVFSNVAGILKAHVGRKFSEKSIADILTELRSVGDVVRGYNLPTEEIPLAEEKVSLNPDDY